MQDRPRVVVDPAFRSMDEVFSPEDRSRLEDLVTVVWGRDEPISTQRLAEELVGAVALVQTGWRHGDLLDHHGHDLRAVIDVSGGFPTDLDYDRCDERRIRVLGVAPAFARQVAEMCLALALAALREVPAGDRAMRRGDEAWLHAGNRTARTLFDRTIGIVGYGGIARALHPLLAPFGGDVLVHDPWLSRGVVRRAGAVPVDGLDELLERAAVVFVLAAPTTDNAAMLSAERLELLGPDDVLVLASRAHVVDFDAMTTMVHAGRFKVATDVFPVEPLPRDHPIRSAERAVLSAHRAGSLREGLWEIGEMVVDDLEAIVRGLPPRRLQVAEPELVTRLTSNRATAPE